MSSGEIDVPPERQKHFGSGWIAGVLSVLLGIIGLLAVICFHFPSLLTVEDARRYYAENLVLVRGVLHVVLVSSFLLGVLSVSLRQNKTLGLVGCFLVLISALLGGSQVPIDDQFDKHVYLGLDWFLLNLIVTAAIFVPLERLFGR